MLQEKEIELTIRVIKYEIFIPGASFNELSILHLSDFHLVGENQKIEKALREKIANKKYDFIFITGDLVDQDRGVEPLINYLSLLKFRYGSFCVWGNHDKYNLKFRHMFTFNHKTNPSQLNARDIEKLKDRLSKLSIRVLNDESERVSVNGLNISIIGVDDWFGADRLQNWEKYKLRIDTLKEMMHKISKEDFKILLTHIPDIIEIFSEFGFNMVFAGHTHGGQIRLPFFGPLITWSPFQRKYNRGLYKYYGTYLNVSSGLGTSKYTPIRFFCPPEVSIIKLTGGK